MNLKEAFRYQKFLTSLLTDANSQLTDINNCIQTTKTHLYSKTDPTMDDVREVDSDENIVAVDKLLDLMMFITHEKNKLSVAIAKAKTEIRNKYAGAFDLDAAIETNKSRYAIISGVKAALRYKKGTQTSSARGHRFDAEGRQTSFIYDVISESEERFDRQDLKHRMRSYIAEAEAESTIIDLELMQANVEHKAAFDLHDSLVDILADGNSYAVIGVDESDIAEG